MGDHAAPTLPLDHLRVLDLTGEYGALTGRLLAGLGADVLRIEPPGGHRTRRRGPFYHDVPHPERSLYWFQMNAGKRSVTLNLHTADGRALFRRLVARAQVLIESLPVGELAELGLDFASLLADNPRLVMTSISLYGQQGPYARDEGGDLLAMAAGGLMYLCGDRDRPPVRVTVEQGNAQASIHAAAATLIGCAASACTGRGVHLDVSMQECVAEALANNRMLWPARGMIIHRAGGGRAGGVGRRLIYPAADGYIGFYRRPENYRDLQRWIDEAGIPVGFEVASWQGKPVSGPDAPPPELEAKLDEALERYFATRPKMELNREGQAHNLYVTEVSTPADLVSSPHLAARGFWVQVEHPELGEAITYPGAPFKMSEAPWRPGPRAPLIGEHNVEIYCGELGLSRAELVALKGAGVI